jgi:hypothetical protein
MTTCTGIGNHPWRYVGWNTGGVNNTLVCWELVLIFYSSVHREIFRGRDREGVAGPEFCSQNSRYQASDVRSVWISIFRQAI